MVNPISLSVCKLAVARLNEEGNAIPAFISTGFLWEEAGCLYLITDVHNVTGGHPDITSAVIDPSIPNLIFATLLCEHKKLPGEVEAHPIRILLYQAGVPVWLEHPEGRAVDCVAIPITLPEYLKVKSVPMNRHNFERCIKPSLGTECFVVGYPEAAMSAATSPLSIRATIANEPDMDHRALSLHMADATLEVRMSGSPVLMRHHGLINPTGDLSKSSIAPSWIFLGMHSRPLRDDGVRCVWTGRVIEEIVATKSQRVRARVY